MICSKRGSGKTYLLIKLLLDKRGYQGHYDRIVIFSETFRSQYKGLWDKISSKGVTVYENITTEILSEIYEKQKAIADSVGKENTPSVLIISDDQGKGWRQVDEQVMSKVVNNARHNMISMVLLCQRFVQVSPTIRSQFDVIISFSAVSYSELEAFWREVSSMERKAFRKIFNDATRRDYGFLLINKIKGKLSYFNNFDFKIDHEKYQIEK